MSICIVIPLLSYSQGVWESAVKLGMRHLQGMGFHAVAWEPESHVVTKWVLYQNLKRQEYTIKHTWAVFKKNTSGVFYSFHGKAK